jgi:V8-like Glu-specific endopeptidase
MAAPYSIYSPGMVLSFDGYFSGHDAEWYYYTIPARPGSSGSPIISSHGEVVGIITMASTIFETLAIVTTPDSIRDAYRAIEMDIESSDDTGNNRVLFRSVSLPSID